MTLPPDSIVAADALRICLLGADGGMPPLPSRLLVRGGRETLGTIPTSQAEAGKWVTLAVHLREEKLPRKSGLWSFELRPEGTAGKAGSGTSVHFGLAELRLTLKRTSVKPAPPLQPKNRTAPLTVGSAVVTSSDVGGIRFFRSSLVRDVTCPLVLHTEEQTNKGVSAGFSATVRQLFHTDVKGEASRNDKLVEQLAPSAAIEADYAFYRCLQLLTGQLSREAFLREAKSERGGRP